MEEFVKRSLLYDFYGDLLTDRQKEIYGAYVQDDLSLAEIAQEYKISRQGVHDLIRRCDKILMEYEAKLHLVDRFEKAKQKIAQIESLTKDCESEKSGKVLSEKLVQVRSLTKDLMDTL